MKCLIVEDELMFGEMLGAMLQSVRGLKVMASVRTVEAGKAACREHRPELLILDLGLPDGDGLQVAREAIKSRGDVRILILSSQAANFVAPAALDGNIHAVVDKARAYAVLKREVLALWREQPEENVPAQPEEVLTPRELEVFHLLGSGLMSKEIAAKLGIATETVSLHRKNIATKLHIHGSGLLRLAALHQVTPRAQGLE